MEREVDFLYKINTGSNSESLLHIEFQTKSENDMVYRMQEYYSLIYRKYKLPIRHIVIYLGKGKWTTTSRLNDNEVFKGFDTINLHQIELNQLVSSQIPEVVILGLLGNYNNTKVETF